MKEDLSGMIKPGGFFLFIKKILIIFYLTAPGLSYSTRDL